MLIRPLVVLTIAYLTGILWQHTLAPPHMLWLLTSLTGLLCLAGAYSHSAPTLLLGLSLFGFGLGGTRTQQLHPPKQQPPVPKTWHHNPIEIRGHLLSLRLAKPGQHQFVVQLSHWRHLPGHRQTATWHASNERILLFVNDLSSGTLQARHWHVSDRIRGHIRVRAPTWYANPGTASGRDRWTQQGIRLLGSCRSTQINRILELDASPPTLLQMWQTAWHTIRKDRQQWLQTHLKRSPEGALLRALLLGDKTGIQPLRKTFNRTGTAHLLAISGLHLTLVAHSSFLLLLLCFRFRRRWVLNGRHRTYALFASLPVWLGYAGLSGGSASTQRATCMLLLAWGAILVQRRPYTWTLLAGTALLMLLWEPFACLTPSFQLSFAAVAWLLWSIAPTNSPPTHFLTRIKHILVQSFHASLWATLGTLPLTLRWTAEIPMWGPFVNLIAVPLGGYCVVGVGLAALGMSFCSETLALPLLVLCKWFASWLLAWIKWTSQLPGTVSAPPLTTTEWFAYYGGLAALALWKHSRRQSAILMVLSGLILLPNGMGLLFPNTMRPLTFHFLDIGQGDACWIQFPNGQTMLVDAGGKGYGTFDIGQRVLLPFFRHKRQKHIDIGVLTHPHPDHFGGFAALIDAGYIKHFWSTGLRGHHPHYKRLQASLKKKAIPHRTRHSSHPISIGDVTVRVLHPFPGHAEGSTHYWSLHANDNSLVLLFTYGKHKILLTGDVETRAEEILTQRWPNLRVDVLKVPHHGSRTSSTNKFLRHLRPTHAVISSGRHNRYRFPHKQVLERYKTIGTTIWRTDIMGRITLKTNGKKLEWSHYLKR